ncbi:MAG: extracellular solute-binding protein [Oscillospiraceae bacterium]|nr:extracellular solute-binding protein [Oscillospiraceae bacterium]
MKKIMFAALGFVLLTFLFSCKTDADIAPTSNNSDNSNDTVDETPAGPEFQPLEDANYGGYQFRIFGPGPNSVIWEQNIIGTINEIAPEEETGEPINDAVIRRNRLVEALYNIEIVPVFPGGGRDNLENSARKSILAGDDNYDAALMIGSSMLPILASNNYTYDLFDIPNLDISKSWWNQKSVSELSIANQLHMFTGDISVFSAFSMNVVFQNKELARAYGLENTYELVRMGKWTWDKIIEMSREVARDLDGDGTMTGAADLFGICGEHATMRYMIRSSGERVTKKDAADIPYLAINTANTSKVIDYALESFLNKEIGIYEDDYEGKYSQPFIDLIYPKFRANELLFLLDPLMSAFELRNMDNDFAILPYPKLSEQDEYYTTTSRYYETLIYIPSTCSDIARTGAVIEALGYYSQKYVRPTVIDVTVTNKLIRDEESAVIFDLLLDTRTYDIGVIYDWGGLFKQLIYTSADQRSNVFASQYEKHEANIKTAMEKTFEEMLK